MGYSKGFVYSYKKEKKEARKPPAAANLMPRPSEGKERFQKYKKF